MPKQLVDLLAPSTGFTHFHDESVRVRGTPLECAPITD
jgi:hypothetical protein